MQCIPLWVIQRVKSTKASHNSKYLKSTWACCFLHNHNMLNLALPWDIEDVYYLLFFFFFKTWYLRNQMIIQGSGATGLVSCLVPTAFNVQFY